MKGRILTVLIFLLSYAQWLFSQDVNVKDFIRYTRQDGISNNHVTGIVQDSAGYIWVATQKGLNRFDGKYFTPLFKNSPYSPLPDNMLVNIHRQSNNELIGVTAAGAFSYDPATNRSKKFIIPCDSVIYFWANHGYDIAKDNRGNYVLSTKTGLYIFNAAGKIINRYDYHMASEAGQTELIFGGWVHTLLNGQVLQQNGLLVSLYKPAVNEIDTLFAGRNPPLKKALTDADGTHRISYTGKKDELFIMNFEKNGIDILDWHTRRTQFNPMPFPFYTEIGWHRKLFYINDSTLAIPCKVGGFYLLAYNANTKRLTCNNKKYFEGKLCTAIFKDREGRLWIGTNDGLYKQNLRNSFFTDDNLSLQYAAILNNDILSIYVDSNNIFTGLGNDGGLLITDKRSRKVKKHIVFTGNKISSNTVCDIFSYDKDTLWIGTATGILWLNKNNYHYGQVAMPRDAQWVNGSSTLAFLEDAGKNVWVSFGRYNSVLHYNRATRKFREVTADQYPLLKVTFVFSMAEDKQGNIWLAGDGLCRWNTAKQTIDTLIPYPTVSKALRNYMLILDRDDNDNLWLSSFDNEIIQYNCRTHRMYLRKQEGNWVDGNTVTSSPIIHNNIWLGTDNGISAFNINTHTVTQFTHSSGLPSVAITTYRTRSFYDSVEDQFYIGSGHHLISFTPNTSLIREPVPRLLIDKILVQDSLVAYKKDGLKLTYFQNDVTVMFNAINYSNAEENRFAWRFANASDTLWHELDYQNIVTLTDLAAGSYLMQVKLFSVNNQWPQQIQQFSIHIQPPFWKTTWFMLILCVVVIALVYFIGNWRINEVRKKERANALVEQLKAEEYRNRYELEQISNYLAETQLMALQTQMNPHFIFNALNSIKRMILDEDNANGSRYLSRFAFMIRLTLDHSKKTFVSLKETVEYLAIYLEMEQLRLGDTFTYTIETDAGMDDYETVIPSLMIQPLVENAIWHGLMSKEGDRKVNINFLKQDEKVICCIEDNGIGIRESENLKRFNKTRHQSVGLENLRNRIKIMKEKYDMDFTFEIKDLHEMHVDRSGTLAVLTFSTINH
jgi:ligand-binding sensor domain-containing protein